MLPRPAGVLLRDSRSLLAAAGQSTFSNAGSLQKARRWHPSGSFLHLSSLAGSKMSDLIDRCTCIITYHIQDFYPATAEHMSKLLKAVLVRCAS